MYRRILVAYDGSEGARAALKQGIALAKALNAELSCVLVEEHLPHYAASISEVKAATLRRPEEAAPRAQDAVTLAREEGLDDLLKQARQLVRSIQRDLRGQ